MLKKGTLLCKQAELEENDEKISEEDAVTAMKGLRVLDDEEEDVIFDTGCTAQVLKSGEGLLDPRFGGCNLGSNKRFGGGYRLL